MYMEHDSNGSDELLTWLLHSDPLNAYIYLHWPIDHFIALKGEIFILASVSTLSLVNDSIIFAFTVSKLLFNKTQFEFASEYKL